MRKLAHELPARWVNQKVAKDNIWYEKNDANDGSKDGEEGNDVKDDDEEDNGEDYREASLNVLAEEVFFAKGYSGYKGWQDYPV